MIGKEQEERDFKQESLLAIMGESWKWKGRILKLREYVLHLKTFKSLMELGPWKQDRRGAIVDTDLKLESLEKESGLWVTRILWCSPEWRQIREEDVVGCCSKGKAIALDVSSRVTLGKSEVKFSSIRSDSLSNGVKGYS